METLEKAGTWTAVSCPPDKDIVGSKWVFCIKNKVDGSIDEYKACLVVKCFMQVHEVDCSNTSSSLAKLASFCAKKLGHSTSMVHISR